MQQGLQQQKLSIQSMLASGHRCVHLERHSLLLMGGVGGFLSACTEWVITSERFPDRHQRALALLVWLSLWLGGMSFTDHYWTRRARQQRDEQLPFAQAQITRAWWMLLSMGVLGSFAMFFYGGGAMVYGLWTVLLGLGIYLFGLFSKPLIEWIGLATILLAVASLSLLSYHATHWLNVFCFVIGMPLAGWMNTRLAVVQVQQRLVALLCWLLAVVVPSLWFADYSVLTEPDGEVIFSPADISREKPQILSVPAGSRLPLKPVLESQILALVPGKDMEFQLTQRVDLSINHGHFDGRYRIDQGRWHSLHDGATRLSIYRFEIVPHGAQLAISAQSQFEFTERKEP